MDVTLPTMKPGLIAAPLWTFNDKAHEKSILGFHASRAAAQRRQNIDNQHKAVWDKWAQQEISPASAIDSA